MSSKTILALGAGISGLSVICGAFGAHALESVVSARDLEIYHTAVYYQFIHGFALLILGTLQQVFNRPFKGVALFFILGIVLFSGSLYSLIAFNMPKLGMITPLGGIFFIVGWLKLSWMLLKK